MGNVNSTAEEAGLAYELHLLAAAIKYRVNEISGHSFQGWEYERGATRVVWHQRGRDAVYKVALNPDANLMEHENALFLRQQGMSWAPDTRLHKLNAYQEIVLAMTFYPFAVESLEEVPEEALYMTGDRFLPNYRRTEKRPKGIIKIIDLADPLPLLS